MECERAREHLDEPVLDERVRAHLETCAACRAEVAFGRRVAAAVAAMPRAPAPKGFAASVMTQVRGRPAIRRAPSRLPQMALRWWEMAGIGALCLLLLALVPTALGLWPQASLGDLRALLPASSTFVRAPQAWGRDLGELWRVTGEYAMGAQG